MELDLIGYGSLPIVELPKAAATEAHAGIGIAIVYSAYVPGANHDHFRARLEEYASYDRAVKRQMELIVVDDCSATPLSLPERLDLNVRLFRITKDIMWNSCGARNLGAIAAFAEKLVMCDIDHLVPCETVAALLDSRIETGDWIVLERTDKVTANIYCATRRTYFSIGGYDEQFAGCYGDDGPFRHKLKQLGIQFLRPGLLLERRKFPDHGLSRDLDEIKRRIAAWDGSNSGRFVDFPWAFMDARRVGD